MNLIDYMFRLLGIFIAVFVVTRMVLRSNKKQYNLNHYPQGRFIL